MMSYGLSMETVERDPKSRRRGSKPRRRGKTRKGGTSALTTGQGPYNDGLGTVFERTKGGARKHRTTKKDKRPEKGKFGRVMKTARRRGGATSIWAARTTGLKGMNDFFKSFSYRLA